MAMDDPSLLSCIDSDGRIDISKFLERRRAEDETFDELLSLLDLGVSDSSPDDVEEDAGDDDTPVKKRRKKRFILARRTEDGELEAISPTESTWYLQYIITPQLEDSAFLKKFRRRFRLPYSSFLQLVEDAKEGNWFPRWMGKDAAGKKSSPLELLILGALRYLGRGWTFDDLEECTGISEEVHRVFFHKFIEVGSTILYDKYVVTPVTIQDIKTHMKEFEMAGMPGAPGSSDATHIIHEMCAHRLQRHHKGGKTKYATRSYNMTVNHRRRILGTTRGHPGSWNDKTIVLFDTFIRRIKFGEILDDYTFEVSKNLVKAFSQSSRNEMLTSRPTSLPAARASKWKRRCCHLQGRLDCRRQWLSQLVNNCPSLHPHRLPR